MKAHKFQQVTLIHDFTFIDLFAGIGGIRKGFEAAGGKCVFTSEWDKHAQKTYAVNFTIDHPIAGDITQVHTDDIPDFDVLCAGFPCQPFSQAGYKKGFLDEKDNRGNMFFEIVRILKAKRPKAFMLENVKNLHTHDKGNTFKVIIKTLTEELGYRIWYKVIDAQHFLPQHRERIFIVGFRKDVPFSWDDLNLPPKGLSRMGDVLQPDNEVDDKYILSDRLWEYLQGHAAKHKALGNGFGFGLVTPDDISRTLSARYYKDGSEILVSRGEVKNPRRLTPRECARLMGHGDNFNIPVSDTQAYKQLGNSVAVPVVEAIAKAMTLYL